MPKSIAIALLAFLTVTGCRSTGTKFVQAPSTDLKPEVQPAAYEAQSTPASVNSTPQASEADAVRQPDSLAAEPERLPPPEPESISPGEAPSLDDVVRSVVEYFPAIEQAAAEGRIANGQVLAASGAFDHKLDMFHESQPLDFYENYRSEVKVKRDTTWGGQTFAGYRIGRGVYEPWYLERETNKGGEFKAGFMAPIIRDRVIDANRAELWQAQAERGRAVALLRMAVIGATRDGAAAYWDWVAAAAKLDVAQRVLQLGVDRVDAIAIRIEKGETKEIEAIDNRRIIVSRQAKVADARRKVRQTAAKLSLYLRDATGQPIVLEEILRAEFFEVGGVEDSLAESDILFAQTNRPELAELAVVSRQLGIAIRQACNETWPDVDGGVLVGQDVGEPTSSKRDKSEFELEAKLTLSVPLERRKAFGKLRQLRGKLAQIRAKQQLVRDKIGIDVQVARAALEAAAQRVEQTTEGLRLANQMTAAEQALYDAGQSELFTLNIREKQAAEAAAERIDALLDYHLAAADYAAALGVSQPELAGDLTFAGEAPDAAEAR